MITKAENKAVQESDNKGVVEEKILTFEAVYGVSKDDLDKKVAECERDKKKKEKEKAETGGSGWTEIG